MDSHIQKVKPYSLRSGIFGTNAQKMVATTSKASTIGWSTCTPALPAITPVNEGKMAAPAWATTKMKPGNSVLVSHARI